MSASVTQGDHSNRARCRATSFVWCAMRLPLPLSYSTFHNSYVLHVEIGRKTISKRCVHNVFVDTTFVAVTILSQHCRRKY